MFDETAPVFYCEGVSAIAPSGQNSVVSFAVTVPSADGKMRTQKVNVRVVIPNPALKQGLDFLRNATKTPAVLVQAQPGPVQ